MTDDEIVAYQAALYVVASACAEKVRRRGGSAREMAEAFDAAVFLCWVAGAGMHEKPRHPVKGDGALSRVAGQ